MAAGGSDKSTGDPIRDAIIAQGRAEQELYENALAHEREALKETKRALDAWTEPPSEDAFNNQWFKPNDILDVSDERLADDADKWSIVQELQAGTIRAVARKAQIDPILLATEHLAAIFPDAWRRMDQNAESLFWKTGNLVVHAGRLNGMGHPTADKERYFDIRFDPASFGPKPMLPPPQPAPPNPVLLVRADTPQGNRRGRRPYEYWEPLLIEMARRLYCGELAPKEQADIEHAMQDWLTANNHPWGETQVRQRAHNLWKSIEN
jgi:hypothetical protein